VLAQGLPWISTMLASMVTFSPIVASAPVLPPLGFMTLLAWRLLRPTLLPVWAGLPLGLFDDLYSGQPFGSGIVLWSLTMLAMDVIDEKFLWRGFIQDWLTAAALLAAYVVLTAALAGLAAGYPCPSRSGRKCCSPSCFILWSRASSHCSIASACSRSKGCDVKQKLPLTSAILTNRFERRTFVLGMGQATVGVLLATRLAYLSIFENQKYKAASESNRVNLSLIPPRRGWVLDRNGAALASNRADFRVDVIPDRLVDADDTLSKLSGLLGLTADKISDIKDKLDKARGFQPVEVAAKLDWDKFAAVSVRLPEMPGVIPQRGYSRYYPTGPSVGHLVGYVGPASAEDYERERNPLLITPGFKIGKDGLEKHFETRLRGVPGARRVEATASGRGARPGHARRRAWPADPAHHPGRLAGLCRAAHRPGIRLRRGDGLRHRRCAGDGVDAVL
jgi:rod shape-determining protein MreD